jgi:hypothetical protein
MRAWLPLDAERWAAAYLVGGLLPPEEPELVRLVAALGWRVEAGFFPARARRRREIAASTFALPPRGARALVREASEIDLQSRVEAIMLPRLPASEIQRWVRLRGVPPAPPFLALAPSVGSWMAAVVGLAQVARDLVAVDPLPRPDAPLARARHALHARARRSSPVTWEPDAAAAAVHLRAGRAVIARADMLAWGDGAPGAAREGAFLAAAAARAPVLPVAAVRQQDKSWLLEIGEAMEPDRGRYAREWAEPIARAHPGQALAFLERVTRVDAPDRLR